MSINVTPTTAIQVTASQYAESGRSSELADWLQQYSQASQHEVSAIFARGHALCELKGLLKRGTWEQFLREQLGINERTAQQYMRTFREIGRDPDKAQRAALLSISGRALDALAAENTPESVREEVLDGRLRPTEEDIKKARSAKSGVTTSQDPAERILGTLGAAIWKDAFAAVPQEDIEAFVVDEIENADEDWWAELARRWLVVADAVRAAAEQYE